jgi:hypothetical protein
MGFALEDRLVIQCARTQLSAADLAGVAGLVCEPLDWAYILEVSIRHAVAPLLYHNLIRLAPGEGVAGRVPAPIMAELRSLHAGAQARARRLYSVLGEICGAFEQAGVAVMALKDVQLARAVYPEPGLRPMGDLDLLVHRADYRRAARCLADLGFRPLPDGDHPFVLKYGWGHNFRRAADNVWVDLQWGVMQIAWDPYHEGDFDFEVERMWRGAQPMAGEDFRLLQPRAEDMLFHLCLHLEGHAYSELIMFTDIAEFLRHYRDRLDWPYLVGLATQYQVESSVYYVLRLVQCLFRATVPDAVLRALAPGYFKANLYGPLFGRLGTLHAALDDLQRAAAPPGSVLRRFAATVRTQAVGAMQIYRVLNQLAAQFTAAGGALLILQGVPSERVWPDPALRPFERLAVLILDRDWPVMRQALAACGLAPVEGQGAAPAGETYRKDWAFYSADPALAGQPVRLAVLAARRHDGEALRLTRSTGPPSKAALALRVITRRLVRHNDGAGGLTLPLAILPLAPEELLVYLSAGVGRQVHTRLFSLCSLLEFFRRYPYPLDWPRVARIARDKHLLAPVCAGLQMAGALLDEPPALVAGGPAPLCSGPLPHVLEWARYGPNALVRHTGFTGAFYFLLSLLATRGTGAKLRYLLRAGLGTRGRPGVLPGLLRQAAIGLPGLARRKKPTIRDFAYWIEQPATYPCPRVPGMRPPE